MLPENRINEGERGLYKRIGEVLQVFCAEGDVAAAFILWRENLNEMLATAIVNPCWLKQGAIAWVEQSFKFFYFGEIIGETLITENKGKDKKNQQKAEDKSAAHTKIATPLFQAAIRAVAPLSAIAEDIEG